MLNGEDSILFGEACGLTELLLSLDSRTEDEVEVFRRFLKWSEANTVRLMEIRSYVFNLKWSYPIVKRNGI